MGYLENYDSWKASDELTEKERARLLAMTDEEKKECFWAPLEFGTAGMRGVIDLGVNRMNRFTVGRATKGLADYITSLGEAAMNRGVVIARDTRRKSDDTTLDDTAHRILCKTSFVNDTAHFLFAIWIN